MLTYSFENLGDEPLYSFLYKCIKDDIVKGNLVKGQHLPSKRSFAKHLNISTITIENAYQLLITEGYIYSLPKKGYFVSDMGEMPDMAKIKMPVYDQMSEMTTKPAPAYFADFSSNQTKREHFPFSTWTKLVREVMSEQGEQLLINAPGEGIYDLRKAIAKHLRDFRDMQVRPEQIIIGAGTEYLYGLLIQLLGFNKIYALENPGYQKIGKIYQAHGVFCKYIPLDNYGIQPELLEKETAQIVHISPSHHFPTGITMPISRRYELLGWASKKDGRYIIEDDYDSEFRLSGKPIPTLQSIDMSERVIYMNTFTKTLASTIRISYMVLPPHLLEIYKQKLGFYACTVSNFEQYTLAHFIDQGHYEKHIIRMRNDYKKKRNLLVDALENSPLKSYIQILEEDAGLHFLLKIQTQKDQKVIKENALKLGIHINALQDYYEKTSMNVPKDKIFVINYSNIEVEKIDEAVSRLCDVLINEQRMC